MSREAAKSRYNIALRLVIGCLAWSLLRAPMPVCHAHAGDLHGAEERGLDQHLRAHHPDSGVIAWFDWHVHWVSPWEVRRGELPGDCSGRSSDSGSPADDVSGWFVVSPLVCAAGQSLHYEQAGIFVSFVPGPARFWGRRSEWTGSFLRAHRDPERVRALTCVAVC